MDVALYPLAVVGLAVVSVGIGTVGGFVLFGKKKKKDDSKDE